MQVEALPRIDEHETVVAAGVAAVWAALIESLDGASSRAGAVRYARLVGCADTTASGPRPLALGSTVPGFRVTAFDAESMLALEGGHRFSRYALIFHLEPVGQAQTRLRAESRAVFPGAGGRAYRLLVIGTRGHVVAVRRMLARIERRAEQRP
jgi:hypothetical protein